ncbi:MAG: MFS transporter [Planctomycetota bacterium]
MYHSIRHGQRHVFLAAWIAYAGYYLCRLNFGQVQAALGEELHLGPLALGKIILAHSVLYVVGQLANGMICDHVGARIMAATGAFGSAAMCALLPVFRDPVALMVVWGANGYFQSMGYSACVRALANWFEPSRRGRLNSFFALSYQTGPVWAWMLAAAVASAWGWRFAFYVPAGILTLIGIFVAVRLLDSPGDALLAPGAAAPDVRQRADAVKATLRSAWVWSAGIGASFVSIAMYGVTYWLPNYLQDKLGATAQLASAWRAALFPLAGGLGALVAGWMSDRLLKGHRIIPVLSASSLLGGIAIWAFGFCDPAHNLALSALVLALSGFFMFASHVHVVGTVAMELGGRDATGSSVGIINAVSNLGAIVASIGTGAVVERLGWGWVFPLWGLSVLAGAALLGALWWRRA